MTLQIEKLSERDSGVKMIVYGSPGVGKTYFSSSAPKPLFVDVEGGTLSIKNAGRDIDIVKVTKFREIVDIHKFLMAGQHEYQTVIIDSLTELQKKSMDAIIDEEYRKNPTKRDPDVAELRDWGKNTSQLRRIVRSFRDLPLNVIFTALSKESKDERTGEITIGPDLTPKLQNDVAGYMDIISFLNTKDVDGELIRQMLCQPAGKYMAKDRSGRLGKLVKNPDFTILSDLINGKTQAQKEEPKA